MPLKQQKNAGNARKNAFNASILFQKSSECKKCFFNAGTIARCLVETNTRNKKLVFSSFVSPISRTFYEFRKHKTPKLVFYPTYKEWPY